MADLIEDLVRKAIQETLKDRDVAEKAGTTPEEVAATMEPVVEKVKEPAPPGTVWASTLLKAKFDDDFLVHIFSKTDWSPEVDFMIPEVNEAYKLPKDEAKDILRAWEMGDKTLVYGPTGSGKSSLVQELCARTGRPFLRINATGDMDSSQIFGQLTAKEGSTMWVDGSVTEAVRYGAVLAWDEWEVTPPEIAMGLQWLLEDNSKLYLKEMPGASKDKFIQPHEQFHIVCLGNTQGQGDETGHHAGVNVQNTATLDRFGTVVKISYLNEAHEVAIITQKYPKFDKSVAKNLVKIANLIRQAYTTNQLGLTMSPRTLLGIAKKVEHGVSFREAINMQYIMKLSDSHQRVALTLISKILGAK